ncbi:ssl1-like domain-containing protein [Sarocladium implicatum]|nr:ssl1-like domain-containing protein [Sarocladium implicatum]
MADSDGEFVADDMSDDDLMDHNVEAGDVVNEDNARFARSGGGAGATGNSRSSRPKVRQKGKGKAGGKGGPKAWEESKRSWETNLPEEDQDGYLNIAALEAEKRRRLMRDTTPLQRGIIRHLVLVLDMSFAMTEKDLLPTRMRLTLSYAAAFVREFFEQNPISQLGIVGMRDGIAVRISDLGGNPAEHLEKLKEQEDQEPQGSPSLQNALEMCRGALFHAPSHGTREVLVIYGALLSSDPGDIHETISHLITDRIRVSIVGLSAQVAICAELCARTNAGDDSQYNVVMDEVHYRELFMAATTPPVTRTQEQSTASLLMMGFPSRVLAPNGKVSWADAVKSVACFACQCPFPVPPSKGGTGVDEAAAKEAEKKSGDLAVKKKSSKGVSESGRYACEVCGNHFCIDCDVFAHEVIHNCPGCQSYVAGEGVNGANGEAQTNGAMEVDG